MLFEPALNQFLFLAAGAFLAGFVDSIVGGGGLIQIPVLFAGYPDAPPAVLFGTNKLASVAGTSTAAIQYARRIPIDWRLILPSAAAAFVASWFGAQTVSHFPPTYLRPLVILLLTGVAAYTYAHKDFGRIARPTHRDRSQRLGLALILATVIGFYDGFFGPGAGSFLIFGFIRFLGMDFLRAAASAKLLNSATNLGAILYFGMHGSFLFLSAALMAAFNFFGALLGSRLALRKGVGFVRVIFLLIVSALITKLTVDFYIAL